MSFKLPNELTKHNVTECLKHISRQLASTQDEQIIRLNSVTKIDSAGIAFLLELQNRYKIPLIEPSPVIIRLADLYQINFGS